MKIKPQDLVGRHIQYTRTGLRQGWFGVIEKASFDRAEVKFDNGVEQDYRLDAVQGMGTGGSYYGGYLKLIDLEDASGFGMPKGVQPAPCQPPPMPPQTQIPQTQRVGKFLAIKNDGTVSEWFDLNCDAFAFCLEQVQSDPNFTQFHIFERGDTIQSQMPEVVIINDKGNVNA